MKKKLLTYLSLFVMLSSFLNLPLVVLSETMDSSNQQAQTEVVTPAEKTESSEDNNASNASLLENFAKEAEKTPSNESDTLENTQTDQKQRSEATQSSDQQTRAPNQLQSVLGTVANLAADSLTLASSLTYPDTQNHIVATSDWLTVNCDLTLPAMGKGDTLNLTIGDSDWDYSEQPFICGNFTVTPSINKDGTFTIEANTDTSESQINIEVSIRYKTNIDTATATKELPISIQYQDEVINDDKSVEVQRFKDTIPEDEIIKKVAYGIDKDGNALWGLFYNYNHFNLRGTSVDPFVFRDIPDNGQKIIPDSIVAYDVSQPTIDIDGSIERNLNHDDYNYTLSKYLVDNTIDGVIDIQSDSDNPIGLDDITKSFYIFFATKPEGQLEVGDVLTNKVDVVISGTGGAVQKDKSEAFIIVPPNNNGDQFFSISGTKTWVDNENQDGKRPTTITVNLLADGEQVAAKEVTEADGWNYTFTNLPKFKDGNEIVYTVTENQVPEYNSDVAGFNITNSYTPGETSVSVTKHWEDNENQDGIRPDSITVQLLANGEKQGEAVTLNTANQWTTTWNGLPEKSQGEDIIYTVEEIATPGYTVAIDDTDKGNIKITNTHIPETTEVKGTKTWADNENQERKRPDKITINLLANGEQVASKEVTETDDWNYTFTNLPKLKDGNEIIYTVTENTVENYTTKIDGFNITNTYNPGKISGTVTKHWEDNNNQDGIRPDSIKVQLYANGKEQGEPVVLSEKTNWTYTWKELDATDKDGKMIQYTLKEIDTANGYTAAITGENIGNMLITNTHEPTKTDEPKQPTKSNKPKKPRFVRHLPETGEERAIWLTVIGFIVIGSISVYLYSRKKGVK